MKVGLMITARLKSSRLPMKLLLDLNGRNVIERVVDRCKEIHGVSEIILCTSTNPQDRPLADIAVENDIYYFNGDEVDVLARMYSAAKFFNLDYIISLTADNPLFSIYHTNLIVDLLKRESYDFVKMEGMPVGTFVYGLKVNALELVCNIKKEVDTEIWGILLNQPEVFKVHTIKDDKYEAISDLRLTIDYEDDYRLLQELFTRITFNKVLDMNTALQYLIENPETAEINKKCIQRSLDQEVVDRINGFYKINHDMIMQLKNNIYNYLS